MEHLPFLKHTNIRRYRAKFGRHRGLDPEIGASRIITIFPPPLTFMKTNYSISKAQIMQTLNS